MDIINGFLSYSQLISKPSRQVYSAMLFALVSFTASAADVDIRVVSGIDAQQQVVDYQLSISDCHLVEKFKVTAGTYNETVVAVFDERNRCDFQFTAEGANYLSPSVDLTLKTGVVENYLETFLIEAQPPEVSLNVINITSIDGKQYLSVTANAVDNVDISYLGFSITGLRASDLRSANGVIDIAKTSAFSDSNGVIQVVPESNGQGEFVYLLPVNGELSAAEIASNGLVLYDIIAVDSSGNSNSVSGISFTGEDVNEEILGISLQPDSITISNELEVVALVPTINYQFRGLTPRPGARQGFSYISSDPAFVQVTDAGLVTPLQETNGADVSIIVSFAGQPDIIVPVEIDYSKILDHLEFATNDGAAIVTTFNLPALNRYHQIPVVRGVFTDGSKLALNQVIAVN